jgi:hypothetical protein
MEDVWPVELRHPTTYYFVSTAVPSGPFARRYVGLGIGLVGDQANLSVYCAWKIWTARGTIGRIFAGFFEFLFTPIWFPFYAFNLLGHLFRNSHRTMKTGLNDPWLPSEPWHEDQSLLIQGIPRSGSFAELYALRDAIVPRIYSLIMTGKY